ncbi:MAG: SMC-Scp complex subunit ScpB [Candidatus Nanohaloarchaea archaeon]|nr:SMC-Scp complex subunit ScpB [Candidatus Nanohaloarchaea archaeon]
MDEKKAVLEAALFVSDEPLDNDQIADVLNLGSKGYVQMLVDEFKEDLEQANRGLELIETGEGYQLHIKQDFADEVKELAPHQDLSEAKLRTLSLVAYNAPVEQAKIVEIRGNRAYQHMKSLKKRGLVEASEGEGRSKVLDVTDTFLDYFGIESLDEFREEFDAQPAEEYIEEESGEKAEEDIEDDEERESEDEEVEEETE